jgi:hypothetical protein
MLLTAGMKISNIYRIILSVGGKSLRLAGNFKEQGISVVENPNSGPSRAFNARMS